MESNFTNGSPVAATGHNHKHEPNRFAVIPTALRLRANTELTGKGVTIAFIDSGFYPHPDLIQPVNRILAYVDITESDTPIDLLTKAQPETWDWHGTQTSVAAVGNGFLSEGIYRGLAAEAEVVLIKASARGRITEPNIAKAFAWIMANRERYNIRVVSISLGGDEDVAYETNAVDQAAEEAVQAGIVVVVAAGNSGCTNEHKPVPPANSPSVITVGGYNDNNKLNGSVDLYCSSYGPTANGFLKPEVIAPAMWVAAPILPNTEFYQRASALSQLAAAPDYLLNALVSELWQVAEMSPEFAQAEPQMIRALVEAKLRESKIVATHYQHVDGTSFAAPIVASLAAQMLEANPNLSPAMVKHILIASADRIPNAPAVRQGYGVVNARRAVDMARREQHQLNGHHFLPPRMESGKMVFYFHHDEAESVWLVGDFNNWQQAHTRFAKHAEEGIWRAEIEAPAAGRHEYKLLIDGQRWRDDPNNALKAPDNYGGFNSVFYVSQEAK